MFTQGSISARDVADLAEWGLGRTYKLCDQIHTKKTTTKNKGALLSRQKPLNIHITRKVKAILTIMEQLKQLQSQ